MMVLCGGGRSDGMVGIQGGGWGKVKREAILTWKWNMGFWN